MVESDAAKLIIIVHAYPGIDAILEYETRLRGRGTTFHALKDFGPKPRLTCAIESEDINNFAAMKKTIGIVAKK